jgi:hypothetical protein
VQRLSGSASGVDSASHASTATLIDSALVGSTFPKGRVIRRAYVKATEVLTSWKGGVALAVCFAVAGAFVPMPSSPTLVERLLSLLMAAGVALGLALCFTVALSMLAYRRSNHEDDNWYADAMNSGGDGLFILRRRPNGMPASFTEHGILECVVDTPQGTVTIPDRRPQMTGMGDHTVTARSPGCAPGRYEVRWYGSRGRGRGFYEITRGTFSFRDDSVER